MFAGTLHRQAVRRRGSGVLKGRGPAFCPRVSANGHQSRSGQDQTLDGSPPRAPGKSGVGLYEPTECVHLTSIFSGSSDSARGSSWPSPSAAPPRLRQRSDRPRSDCRRPSCRGMKLCRDTIRRPEDQRSQPVNRRRCVRSEASAMPDRPRQAAHRQPGRLARGSPSGASPLSTACAAARCRALPASSPGGTANVEAPQP